ncbi:class F sortase [uncultured Serinicoccus sp.]|uniref:class F sortase n=1 Tax=uncultured Serinicoccus sp. TaxID=735514 RepID=UPI00260DDEAD|nr:class F sortase [uncultured Serinicoccus sp.]
MTEDVGQAGLSRAARRRRVLPTVAALALLLGGGTAVAAGLSGSDDTLSPPALTVAPDGRSATTQTVQAPKPSTSPPAREESPRAPGADRDEDAEELTPVAQPTSVSIPAIGVTSDLLHLGLDDQGALAVPEGQDYDSAAWYDGSPRPGQDGPAVILGHVSGAAGPSVFFDLARLQVGDTVEVSRADGTTATFEIYDLRQFPKDTFPTAQVYGNTTGPELRVITCGGTFSDTTGHFDDNIIVFAREV